MISSMLQGDLFEFARGRGGPTGRAAEALETGRSRLVVTGLVISMAFAALGWRVVDLTLFTDRAEPRLARSVSPTAPMQERADIVDRNGIVVATSLPAVSVYADPKHVLDVQETADKLVRVLPDLDRDKLEKRLSSRGRFVYLKRNLTPEQHYEVHRLGLPGIQFERGERRVYPQGRLLAHILGVTDIDGRGTAGIERRFEKRLTGAGEPLQLSLDVRIQAIAHEVLNDTVTKFSALGGTAIVMDANTSELVAMVSLPDFDPNRPVELLGEAGFNRATKGVYEMGSTFKLLTAAMALDAGVVPISGGYDASKPMRIARFSITDYHAKNRWLSVPEILIYSSNIGAAKMALDVGTKAQQTYLHNAWLCAQSVHLRLQLPRLLRDLALQLAAIEQRRAARAGARAAEQVLLLRVEARAQLLVVCDELLRLGLGHPVPAVLLQDVDQLPAQVVVLVPKVAQIARRRGELAVHRVACLRELQRHDDR